MKLRETDLYAPIKTFLEGQGYAVKSEVETCDVVAVRGDEPPVIVELKTAFSLQLVLQGIRRQAMSDAVYLAFPRPGARSRRDQRDIVKLCRMLGLGLITVDANAQIEVHQDPGPYQPRQSKPRRGRLLREFHRRVGDPNVGGSSRQPVMNAYRQDAVRCALYLSESGPAKLSELRREAGVERAAGILQRDVYGWFERVARGVYALTPVGRRFLESHPDVAGSLEPRGDVATSAPS